MSDVSDGDGLDALRAFALRETWAPGATLFRQGELPEHLFVIERGEVELWDESRGARRLVQRVGAGAGIGELFVLLDEPSLYTAVARRETDTLGLSAATARDLLETNPEVCYVWLRALSQRIRRGYPRHVAVAGRAAGERVGLFLLDELDGEQAATVDLTQTELASATGLSRQTVSRALESFERLGVVERGRGTIRVVDAGGLRALYS